MYKLVKGLGLIKVAENDTIEPKSNQKVRLTLNELGKSKLQKTRWR